MAKAVRLDKFLADAGKGTRSEVKKFIQKGQVQVNGVTAKKPELKVDPEKDAVVLSGETVGAAPEFVYYIPVSYTHLDVYKRQFLWLWDRRRTCGLPAIADCGIS